MKASLRVLDADGKLLEIGPEIPVDATSVVAESRRLRRKYGRQVAISGDQVVAARERMRIQPLTA